MMRVRDAQTLLTSPGPGGSLMRTLLPAATVLLMLIAVLRWQGERQGLFGSTVGVVLMTGAAITVMAGLMFIFSYRLERNEAQRREADEQLRRSSRYFELSQDLICTAGLDGYFKQLNAAWMQTLGWSEEELCSRPWVQFVHPDDREATDRETDRLARGEAVDFVNRCATKHGGWRWFDWKAKAVLEEGLFYASARDVTQQKAAELALEASELQTRQILESAHDAFVAIDSDGVITEWNSKAEVSFGWTRGEAVGRALATTILPEDQRDTHRKGLERFLATGEQKVLGKRIELTALHRDGREFPVELTISPLKTKSGYSFNAFLRDITERNRAQQELALARDQALEASRLKSMFLANVSHEIRTPMNGVIGMTELLLDTELDERAARVRRDDRSARATRCSAIINDILDFSKIEAGKLELEPTDVRPARCGGARRAGCSPPARTRRASSCSSASTPTCPTRRARRCRAAAPGARQPRRATRSSSRPPGEVVVRVVLAAARTTARRSFAFEVSDTGIGIEREALERLFDPFAQADSSTTRKHGGTGLGLAISRQLMELMGGKLGADERAGQGQHASGSSWRSSGPRASSTHRTRNTTWPGCACWWSTTTPAAARSSRGSSAACR